MAKSRLQNFESSLLEASSNSQTCHRSFPHFPSYLNRIALSIMIRRQLLRQLRASSQSAPQRALIQRSSFSSLSPIPSRTPIAASSKIPRRWQSTETEKASSEAASEGKATESPSPDEPLKQEIEKKNKEIIDLKVSSY